MIEDIKAALEGEDDLGIVIMCAALQTACNLSQNPKK